MTPEKARAIWAIYVWCRRTDELVDGPNASRMNPRVGTTGGADATVFWLLFCGQWIDCARKGLWPVAHTCMHEECDWMGAFSCRTFRGDGAFCALASAIVELF